MSERDIQPDDVGAEPTNGASGKVRRALSSLKRELNDEELASTGVQKMLLDSLEEAQEQLAKLETYRDKYFRCDRDLAVLQENHKVRVAAEIISMSTLALGGGALGFASALWQLQPLGWMMIAIGIVLVIVAIFAKVKML